MKPIASVQEKNVDGAGTHGAARSQTGVRVCIILTLMILVFANDTQKRIFSFTQMYFFALSYMSSWEAMATYVDPSVSRCATAGLISK